MTRYERKLFFERLLNLRESYATASHEATELTIDGLAAFVEQAWTEASALEAANPAPITITKGGSTAD